MLQTETNRGNKPKKATPAASTILAQKATIHQSVFDALPDSAFVRESQLVQSPKRPEHPAPLPFSAPTLWRKVAAGTFPKPVKLSERVTCWKVSEVRAWMAAQGMA
jgi:prophage regulatory protein